MLKNRAPAFLLDKEQHMGSKKSAAPAPAPAPKEPEPEIIDTGDEPTAAQRNASRNSARSATVAASKAPKNNGVGGGSALGAGGSKASAGLSIG